MALSPGGMLSHYRLVEKIGEGGMGVVYLGLDLDIPGRHVAVKLLRPGQFGFDLQRLRNEAAVLASLQHPHILVVHEVGHSPQGPFMVTEYLKGGSLLDRIRRGRLPQVEALRIARDAADALRAAHDKNVLHRDIKPGNLLLTAEGMIKIADFGLAIRGRSEGLKTPQSDRTTQTVPSIDAEPLAGTPGYLAPEVLRGEEAGPQSDQFALGITLHQMLTGKHPQENVQWAEVVSSGRSILDPRLPRELRAIIRRCLAAAPGDRFPGLAALVRRLDSALRKRDPARRRMNMALSAAMAIILAVPAGWMANRWYLQREARRLNQIGIEAFREGEIEEAYRAFFAAHVEYPSFEPACKNLGMLNLSEGNASRAVTTLEECVALFPESPEVMAGLGRALRDTGDLEAAEIRLRSALAHGLRVTREPQILNELSLILIEKGKPEEAVSMLQTWSLPEGGTLEGAVLRKTLGLALLETGRPGEAAEILQDALDGPLAGPPLDAALLGLGRSLEQAGDPTGARKAFSRALLGSASAEARDQARSGLERVSSHRE